MNNNHHCADENIQKSHKYEIKYQNIIHNNIFLNLIIIIYYEGIILLLISHHHIYLLLPSNE